MRSIPGTKFFGFPLFLLALFSLVCQVECAAGVMGIDFGTDWFKVAVVKPGVPLDVVLNKESKRKTETIITFKDGIRLYGSDAAALSTKRPQDSYGRLKNLLGRSFDDEISRRYRELYDNTMVKETERGTCAFKHSKDAVYSVEELVAMQLAHARDQCEKYVEDKVTDAIITVPAFWTHHERKALLDAADIAGIRVLSLVNDATAALIGVAVNYAMTRIGSGFNATAQYHIIYDIGAGSSVATLLEFRKVVEKKGKKSTDSILIETKSIGYDRSLGGLDIDIRLQMHLAQKFQEQIGNNKKVDVFKNHRAMARLLKEANRVKHVLSANAETSASVEGLIDEIDFRTTITRIELEAMLADFLNNLKKPLDSAVELSGLKWENIQSVILFGGSTRVPCIHSKLEQLVGTDKLAKHVNADEAAVLGATLRGAHFNPNFRVAAMTIKDGLAHGVNMQYQSGEDGVVKDVTQKLFAQFSPFDIKKKASFKKNEDFSLKLAYDPMSFEKDPELGHPDLLNVRVMGVTAALGTSEKDTEAKVKVVVDLSNSGVFAIEKAQLELTKKPSTVGSIADSVRSFFGGDKKENSEVGEDDDKSLEEALANNSTETNEKFGKENKTETAPVKVETIPLNFEVEYLGIRPLFPEEKSKSKEILKGMDAEDEKRIALESAQNKLESFLYSTREFLESEKIKAVTIESQRDELQKVMSSVSEWFEDSGYLEKELQVFLDKLQSLQSIREPIARRLSEKNCRNTAVSSLRGALEKTRLFVTNVHSNVTEEERVYENSAIETVIKAANDTENWLNDMIAKQEALKGHEEPVLLCANLEEKGRELEREKYLATFKKRPKPKTTSTLAPTPIVTTTTAESEALPTTTSSPPSAHDETIKTESPEKDQKVEEQVPTDPAAVHEEL